VQRHVRVARQVERETGQHRDAETGRDQPEHRDVVVGLVGDLGREPGVGADLQQVPATTGAAGDPGAVGEVAEADAAVRRAAGRAAR
jgi:hypothetical protein